MPSRKEYEARIERLEKLTDLQEKLIELGDRFQDLLIKRYDKLKEECDASNS